MPSQRPGTALIVGLNRRCFAKSAQGHFRNASSVIMVFSDGDGVLSSRFHGVLVSPRYLNTQSTAMLPNKTTLKECYDLPKKMEIPPLSPSERMPSKPHGVFGIETPIVDMCQRSRSLARRGVKLSLGRRTFVCEGFMSVLTLVLL